jgi:hypothetical protein
MGKLNILYILHAMLGSIMPLSMKDGWEIVNLCCHSNLLPTTTSTCLIVLDPKPTNYELYLPKLSGTSQLLTPVRRAMQVRKPGNLIILIYHFLPPFAVFVLGIALKIYKGKDY